MDISFSFHVFVGFVLVIETVFVGKGQRVLLELVEDEFFEIVSLEGGEQLLHLGVVSKIGRRVEAYDINHLLLLADEIFQLRDVVSIGNQDAGIGVVGPDQSFEVCYRFVRNVADVVEGVAEFGFHVVVLRLLVEEKGLFGLLVAQSHCKSLVIGNVNDRSFLHVEAGSSSYTFSVVTYPFILLVELGHNLLQVGHLFDLSSQIRTILLDSFIVGTV